MSRTFELSRTRKSASVQIIRTDRWGVDKLINGRTVDVSNAGMRIEVPEPIETETYVTLCSALGLQGRAAVRSCIRKGMKYLVALDFDDTRE
jgi:hypothetical protein